MLFYILTVLIMTLYYREMWFAFYPKNSLLFCFLMFLFPILILYKREMWFAFYPNDGLLFNILIVLISILYKREMWFAFYPKNGLLFISWKSFFNWFAYIQNLECFLHLKYFSMQKLECLLHRYHVMTCGLLRRHTQTT